MRKVNKPKYYSPQEERLNVLSHGLGLILSVIALYFLITRALTYEESKYLVSFTIFGLSMVLLYAASTSYHSATTHRLRMKLNVLDHASIYVLIAGTYTPFAMVTLSGTTGLIILWTVWICALVGIILKLFFTGRYQLISTIMYVAMGWIIVFAINPLMENLSTEGLKWLFAGGISYTIGAILFMQKRIPFNHAIFHLFVLLGTFAHFVSIYFYILPAGTAA